VYVCSLRYSAVLSSVACPSVRCFSTLSHKRHDFLKKNSYLTQNVFFDFLYKQRLSDTFLILSRIQRGLIGNVCWSLCEVSVTVSKLDSFNIFVKNTQISNFLQICPLGADWFHVDGQRDITKLIVAFRNSANAHAKGTRQRTD
jgi:hypothetical protein